MRERRNKVPDEDLFTEAELLVYGHFHEDDEDNGFKATRWVSWQEVEQCPTEHARGSAVEAFEMLTGMLGAGYRMLAADDDDDSG